MRKISIAKILFFPIIVALVTTLSIVLIEGAIKTDLIHFSTAENILFFVLIFLTIYFFTIILVAPINIYISKKLGNKLISFILFNIIGLILIGCIDIWFLDIISLYLIFPLFSILTIPFLRKVTINKR
ncbi:pilus assembly protein PilB [Lysinibacillus sp. JNUCC 51]|uniref:pilus assembly protein PilB n=1 Tax=Lysinibacillus sp. JNUCC-51 TaxID=2792479 RepID=UPI001936B355|nr:pilus assembly protein PilB [Lysinibacillus sp. JNUCC-51]